MFLYAGLTSVDKWVSLTQEKLDNILFLRNKFASKAIPSQDLLVIEVNIQIKFKLKAATIVICLFTYMLFGCLLHFIINPQLFLKAWAICIPLLIMV